MIENIRFQLNGRPVSRSVETERMLLSVLRYDLGLTGTKYGCGEGYCGACTVLVDKEAVRSCQTPVKAVRGKEVLTIEGLASQGKLHPLQQAFVARDALQCGYCTSGMIMNALGLLLKNPSPTRREISEGMEGNLCRCGAHVRILEAVEDAARIIRGGK